MKKHGALLLLVCLTTPALHAMEIGSSTLSVGPDGRPMITPRDSRKATTGAGSILTTYAKKALTFLKGLWGENPRLENHGSCYRHDREYNKYDCQSDLENFNTLSTEYTTLAGIGIKRAAITGIIFGTCGAAIARYFGFSPKESIQLGASAGTIAGFATRILQNRAGWQQHAKHARATRVEATIHATPSVKTAYQLYVTGKTEAPEIGQPELSAFRSILTSARNHGLLESIEIMRIARQAVMDRKACAPEDNF